MKKRLRKANRLMKTAVKRLKGLEISAKEKVDEIQSKASEFAHQGADAIADSKNRLKKAIDAGVEAYREENIKTGLIVNVASNK